MIKVLANATVALILQYTKIPNPHIYTLDSDNVICQLYLIKKFKKQAKVYY